MTCNDPIEIHINTRGCKESLDEQTVRAVAALAQAAYDQEKAKMTEKYSADWIRDQVQQKSAQVLLHHDCAACGAWVMYRFSLDGVTFDASCGCGDSHERPSSFDEIARWLAMQDSDERRDKIMERLLPR